MIYLNKKLYKILKKLINYFKNLIGIDNNFEQPLNIEFILVTLLIFHFDISGKDDNDEQL